MLRALELNRRHEVGFRTQFVFRTELVLKSRLRRHEEHAIRAARIQRETRSQTAVGELLKRDRAALLPLLQPELGSLHIMIWLQLEIDLRAIECDERAVLLCHRLVRKQTVFRIMIRLFELRDVRPLARIQQMIACHRVARFDAVAHTFTPHIHRRGKSIAAERLHVGGLPSILAGLRNDVRLVHPLAAKLHHDAHRIALRHQFTAAIRLDDLHLCPRNAIEICRRPKRPQQQRGELPARRRNHRTDHAQHRRCVADVAPHELHGQKRLHLHALHFPRDIILQKRAELLGIKHLALRLPKLYGGQQIFTQPWLRMLDEPRELPRIRRVKQPRQTLPPRNHQHRQIRGTGQRPAQPVGHSHRKIDRRDDEHREQ